MAAKVRFRSPNAGGDVEGHSADQEVDVEGMRLETTGGEEIALEPDGDEEGSWRVVAGPDDVMGHAFKVKF
jgi:hypothetical protein